MVRSVLVVVVVPARRAAPAGLRGLALRVVAVLARPAAVVLRERRVAHRRRRRRRGRAPSGVRV